MTEVGEATHVYRHSRDFGTEIPSMFVENFASILECQQYSQLN